jgi:hypothetical protein
LVYINVNQLLKVSLKIYLQNLCQKYNIFFSLSKNNIGWIGMKVIGLKKRCLKNLTLV